MTHIGNYRAAEGEIIDVQDAVTRAWMADHFPAIMATRPTGMSEGYQFMPSFKIAEQLQERFGLALVEVGQQFSRARDPKGQEHFMKFRLPSSMVDLKQVGDSVPEIVIMNSHNGRSKIKAYAGIFRLVCANGMVVSEKTFGQIKLRHFGEQNSFDHFKTVLDAMARKMAVLDARLSKMNSVLLDQEQQVELAKLCLKQRAAPEWLAPEMVLDHHRDADAPRQDGLRSMWLTYNVVQENLTTKDLSHKPEEGRARSMRPLSGARAHILTNEKLWTALEQFVDQMFPEMAGEIFEHQAEEAQGGEPEQLEAPLVRNPDEILALPTYEAICGVTDAELEAFDREQRKKFSKRKSYLKRKEGVDA